VDRLLTGDDGAEITGWLVLRRGGLGPSTTRLEPRLDRRLASELVCKDPESKALAMGPDKLTDSDKEVRSSNWLIKLA